MGQSRVVKRERKPAAVPGENEEARLRVEKLRKSPEPKRRVTRLIVAVLLGAISASCAGFFLLTLHLNNWPIASLLAVAFYTTAWWAIRMTAAPPPPRRQLLRPNPHQLRGWLPADPPPSKAEHEAAPAAGAASERRKPGDPCAPCDPQKPQRSRRYGTGC